MSENKGIEFYAQMGGIPRLVIVEDEDDIKKINENPLRKGERYIFARVMGTRPQKTPITWINEKGKMKQVTARLKLKS